MNSKNTTPVTGAAGIIGPSVCREFKNHGRSVAAAGRPLESVERRHRCHKEPHPAAAFCAADRQQPPRRIRDAAAMHSFGYICSQTGRQISITAQAVSITQVRHRRKVQPLDGNTALYQWSARAANVLGGLGVSPRQEAVEKGLPDSLQRKHNEENLHV